MQKKEGEINKKKAKGIPCMDGSGRTEKEGSERDKGVTLIGGRRDTAWKMQELGSMRNEKMIGTNINSKEKEWVMILTYMRGKRRERIEEMLEEETENTIIIDRDFNGSTGSEGAWIGEEEEELQKTLSKDKELDKEGEKLINRLRNNGLYITNGGTNSLHNPE